MPELNNHAYRPQTPNQLPQTVFPPNNGNLHLYEDEDNHYPEPPSLNIPLLTVTGPHNYAVQPLPTTCFSPQPTRDAYQMEPDEETAAVLNQVSRKEWVGVAIFILLNYEFIMMVVSSSSTKDAAC